MGELPQERLAAYEPAFTNTAIDYFGPFVVAYGRGRTTKRYGALFACLTSRAVHLNLALSLSLSQPKISSLSSVDSWPSTVVLEQSSRTTAPTSSEQKRNW